MGLIAAAVGAVSNTLKDQWKEFFYCDSLDNEVLFTRGVKMNTKNNKGNDNVITNGSKVVVADGQCALIVEDGRVVEICAEPGGYIYDNTVAPTVFAGGFGKGLVASFKKAVENFTYGGTAANYQRIYYFNTREIIGNMFGTQNPIPFRIYDRNIGLDIDISVRCNGTYTFRITDPMAFYSNIGTIGGGNYDRFSKGSIDAQLRSEFLHALQPAFAKISEKGVRPSALPGMTDDLRDAMNEALSQKWAGTRGIVLADISINSITIPKEDEELIKQAQRAAINRDPSMAAASIVTAQSQAMQDAAKNPAGAMQGFMGMGFAQQAGGVNPAQLFGMAQQQQAAAPAPAPAPAAAPAANSWTCSCGAVNTAKFCSECGSPKPAPAEGWTCSCGTVNQGKFCMNCGAKKPAGAPMYKCDKCGWVPEDPAHPPKFCPECGDVFDENDAQ